MNKNFKFYIAIWTVLTAVFNTIAFVSVGWIGYEKYTVAFWIGYGFIMLSFVINVVYALLAFCKSDPTKTFYNISFFRIGYAGLILSFVTGGAFMLIPGFSYWVCVLISAIVLGANTLSFIKANAAAQLVDQLDETIAENTQFIKLMTADAQSLIATAKNEDDRLLAQKVYEALRYSDIVSNPAVSDIENRMSQAYSRFSQAILSSTDSRSAAQELLFLIDSRNARCKATK